MEVARPWVGEDMDTGGRNCAEQALGLIAIGIEEPVDGGEHALDLESFAVRYVEGPVIEDLDLEALENSVLLAETSIPPIDALPLQSQTFRVETRGDLESA